MLHWKTKLVLDLKLNRGYTSGGGGEKEFTYKNKKEETIVSIPMEAEQFLEMAHTLICKANSCIEKNKNLTY